MALSFNGKEANKICFNNNVGYIKVGNPTIVDGVASGFSMNNYLDVAQAFDSTKPFQIHIKVNSFSATNSSQYIFGMTGGGPSLGLYFGGTATSMAFSYGGSYWTKIATNLTVGNPLTADLVSDGTNLSITITQDAYTKTSTKTLADLGVTGNYTLRIGKLFQTFTSGSIDLNETYIKVNGITWFSGKEQASKDVNYVIKDGKLVWANTNLYIASNGGSQFVKTDFRPTTNTTVIADWKIIGEITTGTETRNYLFGSSWVYQGTNSFIATWWVNDSGTNFFWPYIGNSGSGTGVSDFSNKFKYRAIMNGSGSQYLYNLTTGALIKSWGTNYSFSGATSDFYILKKMEYYTSPNTSAIHTLKILENEKLIYHFVPVPAGLKIGDYTVPSNGMWDIVSQQFFGNSGTGEFSYGKDE